VTVLFYVLGGIALAALGVARGATGSILARKAFNLVLVGSVLVALFLLSPRPVPSRPVPLVPGPTITVEVLP